MCKVRYAAWTLLVNEGVPDPVDYRYSIMHDKFIVVDAKAGEESSFNFTSAAEHKNAWNVLVVDNPHHGFATGRRRTDCGVSRKTRSRDI